ncbi:4-(cytidine 5'-diphospho)-2-C-methyl-D-erythritol kinase [Thermotoga profunda]|uniref:4-(cytidine 5'-diphospho)-2-C-methyl-D-erythritol kinase n=1 Tax=Thermotoga profunda TaxID=1508420 RepID=UPI000694F9D4|nr:4-(cytidine 5'-diphospho)-2-C-methyl-D-erythritol kinase [Thermotoga profunda]
MVILNYIETERAYAKVNLYLDILSKRADGYHDIVGLFQTIGLFDLIEFRIVDEPSQIRIYSNVKIEDTNLIEKAFKIVCQYYKIDFGLEVKLFKNIPIGSGLGGGSSDAAATLRFLSKVLDIPKDMIFQIATKVGSDVPFFLEGGTAIVEGKGEKITPLEPITNYTVNLYCPEISISTKAMYQKITKDMFDKGPKPVEKLYEAYRSMDVETIRFYSYNVFQDIVCAEYSEVKKNIDLAWKQNPITAMMSGTGSCVFGVHFKEGKYKFIANFSDVQ